jgi:hypothetical protein
MGNGPFADCNHSTKIRLLMLYWFRATTLPLRRIALF